MDYIIENESLYESMPDLHHKRNPYISHFVHSGVARQVGAMANEDDAVRRLVNHKHLRKELSESYGALVLLEKSARRLQAPAERSGGDGDNINGSHSDSLGDRHHRPAPQRETEEGVLDEPLLSFSALQALARSPRSLLLLDVCSGKGITSFLLALLLPAAQVVMVDFNDKINREHLRHPACARISFAREDVHGEAFERRLQGAAAGAGPVCMVLGTHLCGHLSTRLVEVFSRSVT